ncbi:MAG: SDR family NAD(P)-dependent oxidoreductase [Polyangiaceae bacterium]|nr:SDR family NAD(P)-dependent oxidoreductase [Polyangiaceae bacterium]
MRKLSGRVAAVTGAAGGIGRATAVALARRGMDLALADVRRAELDETAEAVRALGRRASVHEVDVAVRERVTAFADEVVDAHGIVHLLVNNAGVAVAGTFEDQSIEDFEWLMNINFWGVVHGCKAFLPHLRRASEGHIVNLSSLFGLIGVPGNASYGASKFAVRGLSKVLRAELASSRIGVTSVHPGGVATNIVRDARFVGETKALHERTERAFRKFLPPERVAEAIVRGVRRNSPRVLVGRETFVLDALERLAPSVAERLLSRAWSRIRVR